jgi:hypothetical protein
MRFFFSVAVSCCTFCLFLPVVAQMKRDERGARGVKVLGCLLSLSGHCSEGQEQCRGIFFKQFFVCSSLRLLFVSVCLFFF